MTVESHSVQVELVDEYATLELGAKVAALIENPMTIFLTGQLGAGKTTFSRGLLRAMGHHGAVKSPTFTIVEPYSVNDQQIYHFDLYRLEDPEELEYIGIDDYLDGKQVCLVEWPERGLDRFPDCDLSIDLSNDKQGRIAKLLASSSIGERIRTRLVKQ